MAEKSNAADTYFSSRPEKIGAWTGFKQFLWNPETSQVMGRTGGSWGKNTLKYHIMQDATTNAKEFFPLG